MSKKTYPTPRDVTSAVAVLAIVLMLLVPTDAQSESRTFYDRSGRVSGRSITGTNGSTVIYDSSGRVTGRTSTGSNGTTTIYGADGRKTGTVTTPDQ